MDETDSNKEAPSGCFIHCGEVCSYFQKSVPIPEDVIAWELKEHPEKRGDSNVYYIKALSPTEILAKVEDSQIQIKKIMGAIGWQVRIVKSLCSFLELVEFASLKQAE